MREDGEFPRYIFERATQAQRKQASCRKLNPDGLLEQ